MVRLACAAIALFVAGCGASPESLKSDFEGLEFRAYDSRQDLISALGRRPDVMKNVDLLRATSKERDGESQPITTEEVWEFHFDDGRMVELSVGAGEEGFFPQKEIRIERQGNGTLARYQLELEKYIEKFYELWEARLGREAAEAKIQRLRKNEDRLYEP